MDCSLANEVGDKVHQYQTCSMPNNSIPKESKLRVSSLLAMYEVIVSAHVALLQAQTPDALYQSVCEAIVGSGQFLLCAVVSRHSVTSQVSFDAAAGTLSEALRKGQNSTDSSVAERRSIVDEAFRTGSECVSNDFLLDGDLAPWPADARKLGVVAGAAVPLMSD